MSRKVLPLSLWCYEACYIVGGSERATPDECGWCGECFQFRERIEWNGVEGSPAYHQTDDPRGTSCYTSVCEAMGQRDQEGRVALPVPVNEYLEAPYSLEFIEPPYCGWCGAEIEDGEPVRYRQLGLLRPERWFEPGYADSRLYHARRCFDEAAAAGARRRR